MILRQLNQSTNHLMNEHKREQLALKKRRKRKNGRLVTELTTVIDGSDDAKNNQITHSRTQSRERIADFIIMQLTGRGRLLK